MPKMGLFDFPELSSQEKQEILEKTKVQLEHFRYASDCSLISVDILWNYREFNHHLKSRYTQEKLDNLILDIRENGFKNPVMLEYNPYNLYCKLGEGNHRLMIAKALGLESIPCYGVRSAYLEPSPGRNGIFLPKRILYPYFIYSSYGELFDLLYPSILNPQYILPECNLETGYVFKGKEGSYDSITEVQMAYLSEEIEKLKNKNSE